MAAAVSVGATLASAQQSGGLDLAITAHASTLGFGGEVSKLLMPHIAVRVGANAYNYKRTQTSSDIDYNAALDFKNFTGLADYFPRDHGSFHLTGGLVLNNNKFTGTGVPSSGSSFDLNGTTYTSAQVGTLDASIAFPKTSGYAGLGWGSPSRGGSRIRLVFDLGAVLGTPTVSMSATGASSNAQLNADLAKQRDKTQKDVNKLKAWPVISAGLSYHV